MFQTTNQDLYLWAITTCYNTFQTSDLPTGDPGHGFFVRHFCGSPLLQILHSLHQLRLSMNIRRGPPRLKKKWRRQQGMVEQSVEQLASSCITIRHHLMQYMMDLRNIDMSLHVILLAAAGLLLLGTAHSPWAEWPWHPSNLPSSGHHRISSALALRKEPQNLKITLLALLWTKF